MNPLLEDKQVWFTSKFMSVLFSRGYDFSFHFLKFVFERILNENSFFFCKQIFIKRYNFSISISRTIYVHFVNTNN